MDRPSIVIVTPALADANNGNWRTARRWADWLAPTCRVRLAADWQAPGDGALMIALHARRSAGAVAAWRAAHPRRPLLLVLTGTDLYRDIHSDAEAQASLTVADVLVVLNELGARALPEALRAKVRVILQSCPARQPIEHKPQRHLRALVVGHLRDEKDPRTVFAAVRALHGRRDLLVDHIGEALDPALGAEARQLMAECPSYRWLGPRPHAETRRRIQHAHVLLHPSRIEGGAHVVIEAVRSGTPVLASRIDGNLGLLGEGYPGTFEVGAGDELATHLARCRDDPAWLRALQVACARRSARFEPAREAQALGQVVERLLEAGTSQRPGPVSA